jgi:transposase InsO family protein
MATTPELLPHPFPLQFPDKESGRFPTDNAFIESFNGSLRDECLNVHWIRDLTDARDKLQAWRGDYNEGRPHRSFNNLSRNLGS